MRQLTLLFCCLFCTSLMQVALADNHNQLTPAANQHSEHNAQSTQGLTLSAQQIQQAGVQIEVLHYQRLPQYANAPGNVLADSNASSIVAPRIPAQVIKRLVNIGDHVNAQQALVILSSVAMAKAQSDFLVAAQEWQRLCKLNKQFVTALHLQTAKIKFEHAYAKLLAYGMTKPQVAQFLQKDDASKANGEFTLLAPRNGTILHANFTQGQMINTGQQLYKIVDESKIWVDAHITQAEAKHVKANDDALVIKDNKTLIGKILQKHHQIDTTTRTQIVRISLNNPDDTLHPGEFVTCKIIIGTSKPLLAIPNDSLIHNDQGQWILYSVKNNNAFVPNVIKRMATQDNMAIIQGLQPGTRIVTRGAFLVHAEFNKHRLSAHNH